MKLAGKVVVVAGGAGLLGQQFVRAIAGAGATVVLADVAVERGSALAATLRSELACDTIMFEALDITSSQSVRALIDAVRGRCGKIDAVVNSAYPRGPNYGRKLEDVEYADFCATVNLHLGGYFVVAQQFALFFREQGFGNVVSLASIYGVMAPRLQIYAGTSMTMPVEYAVVKAGLLHLNRYLMRCFQGHAIRFNCISPGGILDGQPQQFVQQYRAYSQTKGMLAPTDVNGALLFLLSDDSLFINGQNLIVDDGFSV
jgi:NAD(P)-dependent dehydrogenase (short-subunit alcohol dehydrogenase family)